MAKNIVIINDSSPTSDPKTIYTCPTGKIAEVTITDFSIPVNGSVGLGGYYLFTNKIHGITTVPSPTGGYTTCQTTATPASFASTNFCPYKVYLVAGQMVTIGINSNGAYFKAIVIEETIS